MSSIFYKFKDLNNGVEYALYLLLVINRTARFCNFIKGFIAVLDRLGQLDNSSFLITLIRAKCR